MAHSQGLEHLPNRPVGPLLTVALSVYTRRQSLLRMPDGANTETPGLGQYGCFSKKAGVRNTKARRGSGLMTEKIKTKRR